MSEKSTDQSRGFLLHNLIHFGRLLRALGLDVNPGRMIDLVNALDYIDLRQKIDFYHAIRSLLIHHQGDIAIFDLAFNQFWRVHEAGWKTISLPGANIRRERPLLYTPSINIRKPKPKRSAAQKDAGPEQQQMIEVSRTYSPDEILRKQDFAELTPAELQSIKQLIAEMDWQLGMRNTRRKQSGEKRELDLRRTFRGSLRYGGEILVWARREKKQKPRPLVVIADISGSMERYTRLLLHFLYGLAEGLSNRVEVFVFSTRLTRITHDLRHRDVDQAIRKVSKQVPDWSGGTRIGEALKTFNYRWARRVLGRGAVALIISDGWDRGEIDLLGREMARLQRSCYRLIWLNPLLGSPEYQPLTRGMQVALPFVDDFLPVHNLESLEDLAERLRGLGTTRPDRVQSVKRTREI